MKLLLTCFFFSLIAFGYAQSPLPYYQIPDYPENYTAESVVARMIDGLGFRYYWATEGLRDEDLSYKPEKDARTSLETLQHIYELTLIIINTTEQKSTVFPNEVNHLSFAQLREKTLLNIQSASQILQSTTQNDLEDSNMVFEYAGNKTEYPFWNLLNGPIADALWHVGQVVSFRRTSGNPFNSKAEVLEGRLLN